MPDKSFLGSYIMAEFQTIKSVLELLTVEGTYFIKNTFLVVNIPRLPSLSGAALPFASCRHGPRAAQLDIRAS